MKMILAIFMVLWLMTSPLLSMAECEFENERDYSKFSMMVNEKTLSEIGKCIYEYLEKKSIGDLTDNLRNRIEIISFISSFINKYNCDDKLYLISVVSAVYPDKQTGELRFVNIVIVLRNNLGLFDSAVMNYDIKQVKSGVPLEKRSNIIRG